VDTGLWVYAPVMLINSEAPISFRDFSNFAFMKVDFQKGRTHERMLHSQRENESCPGNLILNAFFY
jgi:hypothetical protein